MKKERWKLKLGIQQPDIVLTRIQVPIGDTYCYPEILDYQWKTLKIKQIIKKQYKLFIYILLFEKGLLEIKVLHTRTLI